MTQFSQGCNETNMLTDPGAFVNGFQNIPGVADIGRKELERYV